MRTENNKVTIQDLIYTDDDFNNLQQYWNDLYREIPFDDIGMVEVYYSPW